jgi:hypothetical protein
MTDIYVFNQIRKTVWQMFKDRGYAVRQSEIDDTLASFKRDCTDNGVVADPGRLIVRVHRVCTVDANRIVNTIPSAFLFHNI